MTRRYKKYVLPSDTSRCHDDDCPQVATCLRRIQWDISKSPNHTVYSETMRQGPAGDCDHYRKACDEDEGYGDSL